MTFLSKEDSVHEGSPRELYQFAAGTRYWNFTNRTSPFVYLNQTYYPEVISRSFVELSNDVARSTLEITLPRLNDLVGVLMSGADDYAVTVTVFVVHDSDPDKQVVTHWRGRVSSIKLNGAEAILGCDPLLVSLKRPGLRPRYSMTCRHALYDVGCYVSASSHAVVTTVTTVAGSVLSVSSTGGKPDGYFTAGFLEYADGVRRMIVSHVGGTITLASPISGLYAGDTVILYAGCDHTLETCKNRFGNAENFGGFPWIPQKNPFSGDAIV